MAEELGQSRTEAATPHRREEAREQGQVALSADLSTGLVLLAGVAVMAVAAQSMATGLLTYVRFDLLHSWVADLTPEHVQTVFISQFGRGMTLIGAILGLVFIVALATGVLQVGVHFVPGLAAFKWERLAPAAGWSRMFSAASAFRGLLALLKVAVMAGVVYWVIKGRSTQISELNEVNLTTSTHQAWTTAIRLALAVAGALAILGLADYGFQRWRHEQSLKMTRQELKEEIKREEGDPQIKARVRKLQREAAKKRMMGDVPRATVVITNPTHLAIALRYDRASMTAPKVVAKGAGHVAQRIIDVARNHAVPIVERKPLAQALYKSVKIGQEIPAALYYIVAELFAYLYRLRGSP
jgi:flagellar biosynthetic protein FlhB